MELSPDLTDLLRSLSDAGARFLIVGAHAVAYHTEPRYTKDLDVWVEPTAENAARVWGALARFGAPLKNVQVADFATPQLVYQVGIEPNRVDLMMGIDGVTFPVAWRNRVRTTYAGIPVCLLGRNDLIRAKKASGRPRDLEDIARLRQGRARGGGRRRRTPSAPRRRRAR
jgi:predicted nucleotidyltransferase